MNIFVTSENPIKCAQYLDDKRVVKMVLETAQILSNALLLNGQKAPYKLTHKGNKLIEWAAATKDNYFWLLTHFCALCDEYSLRYNRKHKCEQYVDVFCEGLASIKSGELQPWVNYSYYKEMDDIFLAYQKTLADKWENDKRTPTWFGEP